MAIFHTGFQKGLGAGWRKVDSSDVKEKTSQLMPKSTKKIGRKKSRRRFLRTVALGAGTLALPAASHPDQEIGLPHERFPQETSVSPQCMQYPRTFSGRQLARVAFPVGGIGAGSISLGGRGELRDWEIFNRPDKENSPQYAFPSIWVQSGNQTPVRADHRGPNDASF